MFLILRILCDGLQFSVILLTVEVAAPLAGKFRGRLPLILSDSPAQHPFLLLLPCPISTNSLRYAAFV